MYNLSIQSTAVGVWGFRKVKGRSPPEIFDLLRQNHPKVVIQIINAKFVAGLDHIRKIVFQVLIDMERKNLLVQREDLHFLMKMTCQDQIDQAIKVGGLNDGSIDVVVIGLGKEGDIEDVSQTLSKLFGTDSNEVIPMLPARQKFLMSFHKIPRDLILRLEKRGKDITDVLVEKAALLCLHD